MTEWTERAELIHKTLKRHQPEQGMKVSTGETCICGYWTGEEEPGKSRPAGLGTMSLAWHQAQMIDRVLEGLDRPKCPRCGGGIPNNEHEGEYIGAISRWDNKTEICSDCGLREAMIQFEGAHLITPVHQPLPPEEEMGG